MKTHSIEVQMSYGKLSNKDVYLGDVADFFNTSKYLCPNCNGLISLNRKDAMHFLKTGELVK